MCRNILSQPIAKAMINHNLAAVHHRHYSRWCQSLEKRFLVAICLGSNASVLLETPHVHIPPFSCVELSYNIVIFVKPYCVVSANVLLLVSVGDVRLYE